MFVCAKAHAFVIVIAVLCAACGPVQYVDTVTLKASSQVAAARAVGAESYAPYEITAAEAYLHKAREEAGYADFQAAIRFGKKAEELAAKAKKIALSKAGEAPPPQAPPAAASPSTIRITPSDKAAGAGQQAPKKEAGEKGAGKTAATKRAGKNNAAKKEVGESPGDKGAKGKSPQPQFPKTPYDKGSK